MRSILEDIDQMIEQYSATKRRICIILSGKADNLALLVDEITSVERLQDIQPVEAMTENELVSGYASSRDQKHILLLESGRVMGNDSFIGWCLPQPTAVREGYRKSIDRFDPLGKRQKSSLPLEKSGDERPASP